MERTIMIDEQPYQTQARSHSGSMTDLDELLPHQADSILSSHSNENLVFFGSGPVAAKALHFLAQDFMIGTVVTKPKPDHHRGDWPVLDAAQELHIDTMTVRNKQELSDLIAGDPFSARAGIVIDFGIIITQDVIDYFPLGIINSHFSLLPEWRGADPISFSILSGQPTTGVSVMLINEKLDEGPLLAQSDAVTIFPSDTAQSLTDKLISVSHSLLVSTLPKYLKGALVPYPQDITTEPTYSRKLTKEDGMIDWHKPAAQIEREIRAFLEWPKSRTTLAGKDVVITKAHVTSENIAPGDIKIDGKKLVIGCSEQSLAIDELKPAGKQKMTSEAFLAGHKHLL